MVPTLLPSITLRTTVIILKVSTSIFLILWMVTYSKTVQTGCIF